MDERQLLRGAASAHGVVDVRAAAAAGLDHQAISWRVRTGRLDRIHRGVYGVVGAPTTWQRALIGALRSAGCEAAASHRAAAALWRLDGFDDGAIEIVIPNHVARVGSDARVRRVTPLEARDRTIVDGIPVTSVERTVIDLAGAVPLGRLAGALDSALVQRLTTADRIGRRLHEIGRRGRKGAGRLARLLEERLGGARPLESRFEARLERVLLAAGLPVPARQHEVFDDAGLIGRVDLAYPRAKLALEADSYRWHAGYSSWQRDLRRRTRLAAAGWRVIHSTWRELVHEPGELVAAVREALDV